MAGLNETEFEAPATAIEETLEKLGIELASTPWLKALGEGLHEFSLRHDAGTIRTLHTDSGAETPTKPAKILLRLFVHFHGDKVILLLHGYNKGRQAASAKSGDRGSTQAAEAWRTAQVSEAKKPTPKRSDDRA